MLDELLGLLDKPREALYNTFEGLGEGDFGKAAPGLLGILGGGLAATGVGLPLAIALGSGIGGLAQSRFGQKAATPDELLGKIIGNENVDTIGGKLGSLALGAATDPTTYAGFGLGKGLGGRLGRSLDTTAEALGPRYATKAEDLLGMTSGLTGRDAITAHMPVDRILRDPDTARRMLGELPPASTYLGSGAGGGGIAFQTPTNDVVRFGRSPVGAAGRPIDEAINQATRTIDYPLGSEMQRIERSPLARMLNESEYAAARGPESELVNSLAGRGLDYHDVHRGNAGFVGDQLKVIDPGAVRPDGFAGAFQPVIQGQLDPRRSLLHRLFGRDRDMQAAVEAGLANPGYEEIFRRKLGRLGGVLGGLPIGQRPSQLSEYE